MAAGLCADNPHMDDRRPVRLNVENKNRRKKEIVLSDFGVKHLLGRARDSTSTRRVIVCTCTAFEDVSVCLCVSVCVY